MNKNTLKSAVKQYADATRTEIEEDERNFTPAEVDEIINAIGSKTPSPNAKFDLSDFNYSSPIGFVGTDFEKYNAVTAKLKLNEKYEFEMWNAQAILKFRVNEDTGQPEQYMTGVKLIGNQPIQTTLITWKNALEMNKFVTSAAGDRNSKYFLLAQPKGELV